VLVDPCSGKFRTAHRYPCGTARAEVAAFLAGVRDGEFDDLA
jgi:hypothetical protein